MNKENILVIQTAFLGDAILTLPMIQKLKEKFPESIIDVLCIPSTEDAFVYSPYVDDVVVYDKRGVDKSLLSIFNLSKELRRRNYTRLYSPHRSIRTSLLVLLSRIKETYGFDKASFNSVYKNVIHYNPEFHEVQRNLFLIGADINSNNWKILPELKIPTKLEERVSRIQEIQQERDFIAVAPGSVWATKIYQKNYFEEVIAYLIGKSYNIVLIGGPTDKFLCEEIQSHFKSNVFSTAGKLTIIESIQLLKKCKLLISNDSAPTHMAMCADIPALTVYCSTVPDFGFYPYREKSVSVSYDDLACKPCGIHGFNKCPTGTFDCSKKLDPQVVIQKIGEMLDL
ncbi:glycosyltransferase family 9 protein [Bacteroidota bacterium]